MLSRKKAKGREFPQELFVTPSYEVDVNWYEGNTNVSELCRGPKPTVVGIYALVGTRTYTLEAVEVSK